MDILKLIDSLCGLNGVSGREHECIDGLKDILAPYYDEIIDNVGGSFIAVKKGCGNGHRVILDAHLDQIGMIVTSVGKDGLISFSHLGGLDVRTLHGAEVTLHANRDILGVITSAKCYNGSSPEAIELSNLYIYTDMTKEELEEAGVGVGTAASLCSRPCMLEDKVVNRSLDDRISIAVIASAIDKLEGVKLDCDIYLLCSAQEESYGRGCKTAVNIIDPERAIIIDVDFGNTPDVDKNQSFILGKGPSVAISVETDRKMTKKLLSIAKEKEIPHQIALNPTSTGTNASHFVSAVSGVPTAAISIPQRNMHTAYEVIHPDDVDAAARLIAEYLTAEYGIE